MTGRHRDLLAYGVPAFVAVAFAVFLAFSMTTLARIQNDMRDNVGENMLWVLTQAQTAGLRLDEEVARRTNGDVENTDIRLRYDILLSRMKLLTQGPQARYLTALGMAEAIDEWSEAVRSLEPPLENVAPGATEVSTRIHGTLQALDAPLGRAANAAMIKQWEKSGARLDQYRNAVLQVIGAAIGIMLSGLFLAVRLLISLQKERAAQRELARHSNQLEQIVKARTLDLEQAQQRLVSAIDTAPDGFAAFDMTGRLVLANRHLRDLLPLNDDLLAIGTPIQHVVDGVTQLASDDQCVIPVGAPEDGGEVRRDLRVQNDKWVQMTICSMPAGGAVMRLADITPYKMAAFTLEDALQKEQSVNEFYRSFAAMASHQFRTPLAVIDASTQRLARRGAKVTANELAERTTRIRAAIGTMTRLIDNTLNAARFDAEPEHLNMNCCDIAALVRRICLLQQDSTPDRRILLSAENGPNEAYCDPVLIEQILTNLLSNALKYSSTTPVEVRIWADGGSFYCSVKDYGVGIPADELARLFERFFRASTARSIAGTGLGLNLARHLARMHDGNITVESKEGIGSTFTIRLPKMSGSRLSRTAA